MRWRNCRHTLQLVSCLGGFAWILSLSASLLAVHPPQDNATPQPARASELRAQSDRLASEGKYVDAIRPLREAVELIETSLGSDDPILAEAVNRLGMLHFLAGEYGQAERVFQRALAIRERRLPNGDPLIAQVLNNLANAQRAQGDLVGPEPLLLRALEVYRTAFGPRHEEVGRALTNLGSLYNARGDFDRAERVFHEALPVMEGSLGADHVDVAALLNNIGLLLQNRGDLQAARAPLERSLTIRRKALPARHPLIGRALAGLAGLYQELGELERAEPLYVEALELYSSTVGANHPSVATLANNYAMLMLLQRRFDAARPLYLRALSIRETALGPHHSQVAKTLETLAVFHAAVGEPESAVNALSRAADIIERNLTNVLAGGSEQQKASYAALLHENTNITLSLCRELSAQAPCRRLAADVTVRRKGRVAEAVLAATSVLRQRLSAEDRALLEKLEAARSRLAAGVLGTTSAADLAKREAEVEELEASASVMSRSVLDLRAPDLATIQRTIPADAVVIEFVRYLPFDKAAIERHSRFGPGNYAALVMGRDHEPRWLDIGSAADIDARINRWRAALAGRDQKARELGRELDDVLIQPLRAHFATRPRLLFIVPDGALNLIPFAALVDPEDRFLIQSYEIGYLASSRDLVRLGSAAPSVTAPVVVADPAFDGAHVDGNSGAGVPFSPLPGALDEGRAIAALLPGATFLTSDAASETRVKDVRSPVILHLATHGFFTSAALSKVKTEAARGLQLVTAAGEVDRYPLLRSGLALSGANLGGRDGEDGLLTAMEAASLDLQGTQLVVLSACQTGLGEVRVGDGVHGLRRALHLAGARSQVMSLWQVSDTATRDLMVAYYQQLMKGVGRGAALRSVQLAMLAGRNHDPFYWAAFVSAGDWRPMPPRGEGSRHDKDPTGGRRPDAK